MYHALPDAMISTLVHWSVTSSDVSPSISCEPDGASVIALPDASIFLNRKFRPGISSASGSVKVTEFEDASAKSISSAPTTWSDVYVTGTVTNERS